MPQPWQELSINNKHQRDDSISFDEPTHTYTVNGPAGAFTLGLGGSSLLNTGVLGATTAFAINLGLLAYCKRSCPETLATSWTTSLLFKFG